MSAVPLSIFGALGFGERGVEERVRLGWSAASDGDGGIGKGGARALAKAFDQVTASPPGTASFSMHTISDRSSARWRSRRMRRCVVARVRISKIIE
jgi:hypothetical protein